MDRSWRSRALTALLAVVGACAQPREHIRFVDGPHLTLWPDAPTGERVGVYRVVDELGEPIPRAVAYATDERGVPAGGVFWYQTKAEADADGFIRMPYSNERDLEVLMAPGYATLAEDPLSDFEVVTMVRGYDIPLQLVDWMGRPVAGAEVGLTRYCGHRPDFHVFRSGEDGIAWLRGVRAFGQETYVRAPGLGARMYEELYWQPGQAPVLMRLEWSPDIVGQLLDAKGASLAGVPIGAMHLHRGPWTWTDHQGRFRLTSAAPDTRLVLRHVGERYSFDARPCLSRPCVMRMDCATALMETSQTGVIRLRCLRRSDRSPLRNTDLGADGETDADGLLEWSAPRGMQGVQLGDGLTPFESDEVVVDVRTGEVSEAEVLVRERPTVTFRVAGGPKERELPFCELMGPGWSVDVSELEGQPIPVPCDGRAAFWIGRKCFPLPADFATRRDPIVVDHPEPARLKGQLVDASGNCIRGRVSFDEEEWIATDEDGAFAIDADHAWLYCAADDPRLQSRTIAFQHPQWTHEGAFDLGAIPLFAASALCVLDSNGEPISATGWLVRDGTRVLSHGPWHTTLSITGDPADELPLLQAGDAIDLHAFERWDEDAPADPTIVYAPFRFPLEGSGPWTIHVPAGRVTITVSDQNGQALADYAIYYRTRMWDPRTPQLEIRGLHAGKHQFVIAARGHRTCIADLVLADGEQRTLAVRLPPQQ